MRYTAPLDIRDAAYGLELPSADALVRLIAKAEDRLLARVPTIPARVADGSLRVELVRGVVEDIVLRVVRNPDGHSSEQPGPFSFRLDRAVASGRVEVTPQDVATLSPRATPAVGVVQLVVPLTRTPHLRPTA